MKEYRHHLDGYLDFTRVSIQAVDIKGLSHLSEKQLDDADLSLVQLGRVHPEDLIVISDDGAALAMLDLFHVASFQLSEFLLWLVRAGIMKKNDAATGIISLRGWKNIKEKKKESLQHELQSIR